MNLSLILLSLTSILGLATGCCVFNGIAYEEGETITEACVKLMCKQTSRGVYTWILLSNVTIGKCDECCIKNDPHIYTFDHSGYYNWHGTCRYSLAEYIESWGLMKYPPPTKFAVYGDFRPCGFGLNPPSCVHYTSYQLDALPNNVLHVNHYDVCRIHNYDFSFSTEISSSQPTPVIINNVNYNALAWKHGDCLRILGADLLVHICHNYVCIYTSTNNLNHLGGLCGKYNDDLGDDDHTGRNNVDYQWNTNVPAFALAWKVDPLLIGDKDCRKIVEDFECKEEELAKYKEICARYLAKCTADKETLISIINSCAEDLCAFPEERERWLEVALKFCLYQASNNDITIKG